MSLTIKIIAFICILISFCLNLVQIVTNKRKGKKNSLLLLITEALFFVDIVLYSILLIIH